MSLRAGSHCVSLDDCSKNRDSVPDLAPVLWFSYGTMAALLEEIVCVAPFLMSVNGDGRSAVVVVVEWWLVGLRVAE